MSCSECIIYKYITKRGKIFAECLTILCLFCSITCILKKDNVSVLHSCNCSSCIWSYNFRICCKFNFLSKKFGKSYCNRCMLATPAVAALIERACWQSVAAELELDQGTVGTALTLAHTAPTPVGMVVHCDCELTAVEDRRLHFTARVYDDVTEIAAATHERYIVDNERFTRKANSKLTAQS